MMIGGFAINYYRSEVLNKVRNVIDYRNRGGG